MLYNELKEMEIIAMHVLIVGSERGKRKGKKPLKQNENWKGEG